MHRCIRLISAPNEASHHPHIYTIQSTCWWTLAFIFLTNSAKSRDDRPLSLKQLYQSLKQEAWSHPWSGLPTHMNTSTEFMGHHAVAAAVTWHWTATDCTETNTATSWAVVWYAFHLSKKHESKVSTRLQDCEEGDPKTLFFQRGRDATRSHGGDFSGQDVSAPWKSRQRLLCARAYNNICKHGRI